METMNNLFYDLWWFSDEREPMEQFVEWVEDYARDRKGDVLIGLIDLKDFGFENGNLYIAYDDLSGATGVQMFTAEKFIKYMQDIYNEYPELEPQEFWIPRLKIITEG